MRQFQLPKQLRWANRAFRTASIVVLVLVALIEMPCQAYGEKTESIDAGQMHVSRAQETGQVDTFLLYPEGLADKKGPLNPRVPSIALEPGGASGMAMQVETEFNYSLAPFVLCEHGGVLSLAARRNMRRLPTDLIKLSGGEHSLIVRTQEASKGRTLALVFKSGENVTTVASDFVLSEEWRPVVLRWSEGTAILEIEGQPAAEIVIDPNFNPDSVRVAVWHIDEMRLKGDGILYLDWESGYAARVTPAEHCVDVQAKLLGFDNGVISSDPAKRDCPMVQVLNSSGKTVSVALSFALTSELDGMATNWEQTVEVSPRSGVMEQVKFPVPLHTDIYHLAVACKSTTLPLVAQKHFMVVRKRHEPAGPNKFGLHNYYRKFGSWPDALPITLQHVYAVWFYIMGPAWTRDWDEKFGIDPATPSEEWNWNKMLDCAIRTGRDTYVCLQAVPCQPWMRGKEYSGKNRYRDAGFGRIGGASINTQAYRHFIKAFVNRYRGKIQYYEVENEPNTPHGFDAKDYVDVAQVVYEEVKKANADVPVYGVCGTAAFERYLSDVFALGGSKYMDGVSWHTYTTPSLPDEIGLLKKLQGVNKEIAKYGKSIPIINSETGVYPAPREIINKPVSKEQLDDYIKREVPPFVTPDGGWPNKPDSEWKASYSMVANVVYNFLAGANHFVFFGWDPSHYREDPPSHARKFGLFSYLPQVNDVTPNLTALTVGVLSAQLEGMIPGTGREIQLFGIRGGVFKKQNGGSVAVLWSTSGSRSILLEDGARKVEVITYLGQRVSPKVVTINGRSCLLLQLTPESPVYVHSSTVDIDIIDSPISDVIVDREANARFLVSFDLINTFQEKWAGAVTFTPPKKGGAFDRTSVPFSLKPSQLVRIAVYFTPPKFGQYRHINQVCVPLPGGAGDYEFSIPVAVRPTIMTAILPDTMTLEDMRGWEMPGGALEMNTPKQCKVGRSPDMASLQEEKYWKGPKELSGKVKVGYNDSGLYFYVEVLDTHPRLLPAWPGVQGACIELFFDFRTPEGGLGAFSYEKGVSQVLIKPSLSEGQLPEVFNASYKRLGYQEDPLKDAIVEGGRIDENHYWVGYKLPWSAVGGIMQPGTMFGFDVAIDGGFAELTKKSRKSQLILFGVGQNCVSAGQFGRCSLSEAKPTPVSTKIP